MAQNNPDEVERDGFKELSAAFDDAGQKAHRKWGAPQPGHPHRAKSSDRGHTRAESRQHLLSK